MNRNELAMMVAQKIGLADCDMENDIMDLLDDYEYKDDVLKGDEVAMASFENFVVNSLSEETDDEEDEEDESFDIEELNGEFSTEFSKDITSFNDIEDGLE